MDEVTKTQIREHAQAILDLVNAPAGSVVRHTMADKTNQEVINLFNGLFGGLGKLEGVLTVAQRATLYQKDAAGQRSAKYTGPAVEEMSLTAAERARVIAAL